MMANLYGKTIVTSDELFPDTEDDAVTLQQWAEHVLQTKPGTLRTRPEHGVALTDLLLAGLTPAAILSLPAMAVAALERGRRVSAAKATLVQEQLGGGRVAVSLAIELTPSTGGPNVVFTYPVGAALADYMIKGA